MHYSADDEGIELGNYQRFALPNLRPKQTAVLNSTQKTKQERRNHKLVKEWKIAKTGFMLQKGKGSYSAWRGRIGSV